MLGHNRGILLFVLVPRLVEFLPTKKSQTTATLVPSHDQSNVHATLGDLIELKLFNL